MLNLITTAATGTTVTKLNNLIVTANRIGAVERDSRKQSEPRPHYVVYVCVRLSCAAAVVSPYQTIRLYLLALSSYFSMLLPY